MGFIEEDNGLITSRWDEEGASLSDLRREYYRVCHWPLDCAELNERRYEIREHIYTVLNREVPK